MSFDNWRKRLAGETVKTFLQPQFEDEGYYRKPITEPVLGANGKTNGQKRIIGFEPVAYFIDRGKLCGVIGNRDMAANEVTDEGLWSWVVKYPIKEEWFRAVAERGEKWPDFNEQGQWAPINLNDALKRKIPVDAARGGDPEFQRVFIADAQKFQSPDQVLDKMMGADADDQEALAIGLGHNKPPVVEPHIEHSEAIDNAVRAAQDLKATDEATAAVLLGAKNRLAELRIAADKAGHKIYDPLRAVYVEAQKPWPIMVAKADTMEKVLNRRYLEWRAAEKKKADEAEAERKAEAARIEEANARAADRAIAQGMPEPPPEVPEVSPAAMPAPAPVTPTYRASGQRTTPKEVERWWLDGIDDQAKVYEFFKNNAAVGAVLFNLSADAVKNGQEVPGTSRHFGLI